MFDLTGNTSGDTGLSGYKQHVCFVAKIRSVEKRNGCRWQQNWKVGKIRFLHITEKERRFFI